MGTYAVVFHTDKQSGGYRTLVEVDSYATLDTIAAAANDSKSEFGRLIRESSKFGDYDLNAPWSQGLYKKVVDATIFDPEI